MQEAEPLGLLDVRFLSLVAQLLPALAQRLGNLGVVYVRLDLDYLLPLNVGEDHEGIHRPLDVVWRVLLGLKDGEVGCRFVVFAPDGIEIAAN